MLTLGDSLATITSFAHTYVIEIVYPGFLTLTRILHIHVKCKHVTPETVSLGILRGEARSKKAGYPSGMPVSLPQLCQSSRRSPTPSHHTQGQSSAQQTLGAHGIVGASPCPALASACPRAAGCDCMHARAHVHDCRRQPRHCMHNLTMAGARPRTRQRRPRPRVESHPGSGTPPWRGWHCGPALSAAAGAGADRGDRALRVGATRRAPAFP